MDKLAFLPDAPIGNPVFEDKKKVLIDFPDAETNAQKAFTEAKNVHPDNAAEVMRLSSQSGLEEPFVAANTEAVRKQVDAPGSDFWATLDSKFPMTAKSLSDPRVMAVAKDDFDNMVWYEQFVNEIAAGANKDYLQQKLSRLIGKQRDESKKIGKRSDLNEKDIQSVENQLSSAKEPSGFHPVYQTASQASNMLLSAGAGLVGNGIGAVIGGGIGLITPVPGGAAAGAAAGAAIGGRGGAAAGAYLTTKALESNLAYREYAKMTDIKGNPIDDKVAQEAADMVGHINASLEAAGEAVLFGAIAKPVSKVMGRPVVDAIMRRVPGSAKLMEYIGANEAMFANMTLKQAMRRAALNIAEAEIGEVSTEYAQEFMTGAAGELAKSASGQPFEKKAMGSIAKDATGVISPTAQGVLIPALLGGGMTVIDHSRTMEEMENYQKSAKAEISKAAYVANGEAAAASKVLERSPETFHQHHSNITKETPVENVYIPAEALETYFQGKNIEPEEAAKQLGISEDYALALESGGDIKIPLSDWTVMATKIAKDSGMPIYRELADDIKFAPEDMTVREKAEYAKEIEEIFKNDQQQIKSETKDGSPEGYDKVYQYIKEKSIAAGMPDGTNKRKWNKHIEAVATMWASHAVAEARRRGITVDEWFSGQRKPDISMGSAIDESALKQPSIKDPMSNPNFVKWFGDSKVVKNDNPLIVYRGDSNDRMGFNINDRKGLTYFTEDNDYAFGYASESGTITPVYLKLQNPLELFFDSDNYWTRNDLLSELEQYDKSLSSDLRKYFLEMKDDMEEDVSPWEIFETEDFKNILADHNYDGMIFDEKGHKVFAVVSANQIKSAIGNSGEFNPDNPSILYQSEEDPRGAVNFGKDYSLIELFQKADMSTLMHESSHIWLKDMYDYVKSGQAGEEYLKDWQKLTEWLSIKDDQETLTREQQEKFAAGFEKYLFEGKAPSSALRRVFTAFRRWMTNIYREAKSLNAEITDDIRGVMDRMLASEDEINHAEREAGILSGSDIQKLSPEVRGRVLELKRKAHEEAVLLLLRKQMDELKEDHKRFINEKRRQLDVEVMDFVTREKVYTVGRELRTEFMAQGKN
jgi:hypothetical protein